MFDTLNAVYLMSLSSGRAIMMPSASSALIVLTFRLTL